MADVSVRPALPEDAHAVGHVHAATFAAVIEAGIGEPFQIDPSTFEAQWGRAISTPPSAKHRILVALEGVRVVGFAALAPTEQLIPDADGDKGPAAEIVALEIAEDKRREGHGSRLLAACADILRQTGAESVQAWCVAGDETRERFLISAGFAPRGVRRSYDVGGSTLTENAWHAAL